MSVSEIINKRRFIVKGRLECSFTPDSTEFIEILSNLEIELWQKSPLDIFYLGKSRTDLEGYFTITFELNDQSAFLIDGIIGNVFAKVYYKGSIISGENPYVEDAPADSRPIKDITLKEGLTDIGSHEIEITQFEYVNGESFVEIAKKPENTFKSLLFDIREASSQAPLPVGYRCTFRLYINESPEITIATITSDTVKEGFSECSLGEMPVAVRKSGEDFMINMSLHGIPGSLAEQCYLRLDDGSSGYYYTPITNLLLSDVFYVVSEGNYYPVTDLPSSDLSDITIVSVTGNGTMPMYDSDAEEWILTNQLTFYQIEFPENLDEIYDGIYATNGSTGTIISGELGEETFSNFSLTLDNKDGIEAIPLNVELKVEDVSTSTTIFLDSFTNLKLGSKNLVMVETDDFPALPDDSPSIGDIQDISGVTFTTDFTDFLDLKGLDTIGKIKKAGPIRYIDGFPPESITEGDLAMLQGHVDLYTINEDAEQNQHFIDEGYDNLYKIATTPKDVFLTDVEGLEIASPAVTLFEAARIHETAAQNQKLVSNLLSAKLADFELATPYIPGISDSTFADTEFSKFINRCECEDCTSAVSPFAYMVDLVKYGAKHIYKSGSPSYAPVNYNAFLTLLEGYFFQPFGSFSIDCHTLHQEYCRMRLVTEILEQYVATQTLPTEVAERLENDRKNFILLTYKTLLTQAGTSYEELRSVVSIQDEEEQKTAAQRLSNRLGITLYVTGSTTDLTVVRMWLTFDNGDVDQVLNAENLETIFGFRDTERDPLTNPAASLVSEWKENYLFDLWKSSDFLFSAYSREDVDPTDDLTFKSDWKPIIDPDSFGRGDMTYESSEFALNLWRHRKADTDTFLSYFVSDDEILSRTSVDMQGRILRISGKNLEGVLFEDNVVRLKNPSGGLYNIEYGVYKAGIDGINTNIVLKQSTPEVPQPDMFQPEGENPMMRYNSVLNVETSVMSTSSLDVRLSWTSPALFNFLDVLSSGGEITMTSSGDPTIYSTAVGIDNIDDTTIVINSELNTIDFTLTTGSEPNDNFITGNITFVYTAEVALDTTTIPYPEVVCDKLFELEFDYTCLPPAPSGMGPFLYTVWDEPSSWPVGGSNNFEKLKNLYAVIRSGTPISGTPMDDYLKIVTDNLHTDMYGFNLIMETLISCEQYLNSMYTYEKPNTEKLYQMASAFRNCARKLLNENWVKEEIKHIPTGGTDPEELMLRSTYFWKALNEPSAGAWDSSLQTIPATTGAITESDVPIIDPELVKRQQLLVSPDAIPYVALYDARQEQLEAQRTTYYSWLSPTFNVNGFTDILNHINTGDENTDYDISPYATLDALIGDFENTDVFLQLKATNVLQEAFSLTAEAFSAILPVMTAYQSEDPEEQPSINELRSVTDLFVTACKKKRFYFTIGMETGWIEEEIEGTTVDIGGVPTAVPPVKYYNVLEMRLDPVRGSVTNRSEWQRTLTKWNRVPTVFPDIVPPENVRNFVTGNIVHDTWVSRKNDLDYYYGQATLEFNDTLTSAELFLAFKYMLSVIVSRSQTPVYTLYYEYFTKLFVKEDNGEDIRPYLNQLNIFITEYRKLKQVYEVLENENSASLSNLLPSEYEDVINISIRIGFANIAYFSSVKDEYEDNIVLTGDEFLNYSPSIINFPLNLVQETAQWRSPNADKKAWKDTLNSRIERKQGVYDEWKTVLEETEDITMPTMRDALIQALRNNCESLDDAAERLAKTFFIETKDNCCVKHSRVSHAIETIQGLIFSLESGIYDNYLDGFTFVAPNFDKEWQWLGSYGTWRSAVFTYIYPENLLYPTLKRRQSPAFIELAETIQNANRFTPLNACQAAKKYQDYFQDIQNLKVICTANANAQTYKKDPLDCCGDLNNSTQRYMTYYFAQSKISGKSYYSEKECYNADANEHSFWREIPTLRENAKIIGCLPLTRELDDNNNLINLALYLFYTYKEEGELKLAYLKKDLSKAGSEWEEEETIDLPELPKAFYPNSNLISVSICQNSLVWDNIFFIFSIQRLDGKKSHIQINYRMQEKYYNENLDSILIFENNSLPITAVRYNVSANAINIEERVGITVLFEDEIQTNIYDDFSNLNYNLFYPIKKVISNPVGIFKKNNVANVFIVAHKNDTGNTEFTEFSASYDISYFGNIELNLDENNLSVATFDKQILSIAPRFNEYDDHKGANAITINTENTLASLRFTYPTDAIESDLIFGLAPEQNTVAIPIVSGECIDRFDLRAANIKEHMKGNLNAPQGNPVGTFVRPNAIKDVLYEAYYFVPMLIALDQQQRGDFPTALDWYRSVYDYTNNLATNRKIFYGLVLEQSITNVFDRPADWLLDPLNPHLIAETRTNAYTKYTLMNIIQCMLAYGDREFTIDTVETVPNARKLYTEALDLMKVSELRVKPSQCYTKSHNCFETSITAQIEAYWNNSFNELQSGLESLNDVALIEEASEELATILNDEEDTMEEKFTAAFTYLSEFSGSIEPTPVSSVTELMDGISDRMNDAYRYLFAEVDTHSFNSSVEGRFTNTLAKITSLTPELIPESSAMITWLKEPVANNATPLTFQFINEEGGQLLNKTVAYNPMNPAPGAYQANLVYTNAAVLYEPFLYEEDFTPFIDYAFCLPSNPVYSALELKANLELFKIHNCRNIAGIERSLDIFAAPTDSTTGVPVIGAGGNLILPGAGAITPSQYRFRVLVERAKQLVSQAQQLEGQFLATLEKEDAENYSQLRARQDLQIAKSTVKLQDMRVKQAQNEEVVADIQHTKMTFVKSTYDGWIDGGNNAYEIASIALLTASVAVETSASIIALTMLGKFDVTASLTATARTLSSTSSILSQLASYQRRAQEWQLQSNIASFDIALADQQIKIAEQNTRIVSQEREIASLNMDHATDTLEFLKTKFTNAELYRWMGNVLERTYSYMLSLATATAKTAEQQYYFEQQEQAGPFIMDDYWEVPQSGALALNGGGVDRRGLTGSARLLMDLTKLDQYAFETTKRKLQMTKVISLGQNFPEAFQDFRDTGVFNFDLTNRLFDYDFPGHYLRLINGVKVSVIGLVPVYDGIKATLTAGTTSYTVINANNTFQRIPIRRMENDQVALTGASRATGMFELQPAQGELLNPFEGMGVESHWEFKMPKFSNRMDYSNIADVLIEVDYTAMDNFQYRYQVLQDIDNTLGFSRGFSFKNNFPDQWYELAQAPEGGTEFSVDIEIKRDQFPQGIDNIRLDGSKILLHFVRKDGFTEEIEVKSFMLADDNGQANSGGPTQDGTFGATYLTDLNIPPFAKLRLVFDNSITNRELFSEENVTDILLLMSYKADLPVYPL